VSGHRAVATASLRGSGVELRYPEDVLAEPGGSILVTKVGIPALLRVDPVTGDRDVVSGCADASCASAVGSGTLQSEPLGITLLPEPDAWLSLTACLAFLALAKRRRP